MRITFEDRSLSRNRCLQTTYTHEYELNTGHAIVRRFRSLDPLETPAVLVAGHAPFCWGASPSEATHNAVIVEELAHLALLTLTINAQAEALAEHLRDKHFLRKHGKGCLLRPVVTALAICRDVQWPTRN